MASLNKVAASATLHCLTGCAIGEVSGMFISTALGWSNALNVLLSVSLAFLVGYSFTMKPLLGDGLSLRKAIGIALLADTASIAVMETADTSFILAVPGAINAGLSSSLFWVSLGLSLVVAYCAAFPMNRYLISRGKGHACAHPSEN